MSQKAHNPEERFRKNEQRKQDIAKQLPGEDEEQLPPPVEPIKSDSKPNRNDPCPCGSGKKYKQCCAKSK